MAEATAVKTKKQFHLRFVFDFERMIEAETAEEAKAMFEDMVEEQWSQCNPEDYLEIRDITLNIPK